MTTIIAKHGKTYTLADGDQITFGGPLKSTEGDGKPKPGRFAYRWGKAAVCYLYVPRLDLVEGSTYREAAAVETPAPEPTPAPPPPAPEPTTPPASNVRTASGTSTFGPERYITDGRLFVGFSANGSIGTSGNDGAPKGFETDLKNGFKRLGVFLKQPEGAKYIDDLALQARSPGGIVLVVNGKTYANETLNGYRQIPGVWSSDTMWSGGKDGLTFTQTHGFTDAGELYLDYVAENQTDAAMEFALVTVLDPDASSSNPGEAANFNTTQKVTAAGTIQSTTSQGATITLSCDDAAAHVRTTTFDKAYVLGVARAAGYTKKADETVQVGVHGTLPKRGKKAWRVLMGVTVA